MELRQLQYFECIAETGNVTRAAERLYVTAPSLSKSISRLESELGVQLFDRVGGNHIVLNEFGRVFLHRTKNILKELDEATQQLRDMNSDTIGPVKFSVPGYDLIESMVEKFTLAHPKIRMYQVFNSANGMMRDLDAGTIDFAVNYTKLPSDRFCWECLIQGKFMALLSDRHPLASQESIPLSALANESFVINNGCIDQKELVVSLCQQAGFEPNILFEGDAPIILNHLLVSNQAVSLAASHSEARVESNLEPRATYTPHLVAVPISIPDCSYEVGIITKKGHYISRGSRLFIDFICEEMPRYLKEIHHDDFLESNKIP